jgi:formate dehydrogenase subunit gamma
MAIEPEWDKEAVRSIAFSLKHKPGALLPILHEVQGRFGYIPAEGIPVIAAVLNLSRAEVHGVVSFYHDFRSEPPGKHVIRVCRAESCQAMGAVALASHIKRRLQLDFGQTSDDRLFALEAVYCLGNCACSPAITIDEELYGRVTAQRFDRLLARFEGRRS